MENTIITTFALTKLKRPLLIRLVLDCLTHRMLTVKNTGAMSAKEIVQVYVTPTSNKFPREQFEAVYGNALAPCQKTITLVIQD